MMLKMVLFGEIFLHFIFVFRLFFILLTLLMSYLIYNSYLQCFDSVDWKGIQPVKTWYSGGGYDCSWVQMICRFSVQLSPPPPLRQNHQNCLTFWYWLFQVVLEIRHQVHVRSRECAILTSFWTAKLMSCLLYWFFTCDCHVNYNIVYLCLTTFCLGCQLVHHLCDWCHYQTVVVGLCLRKWNQ